nr:hypothetical protein [Streptomyces sp. SM18]
MAGVSSTPLLTIEAVTGASRPSRVRSARQAAGLSSGSPPKSSTNNRSIPARRILGPVKAAIFSIVPSSSTARGIRGGSNRPGSAGAVFWKQ